MDSLTATLETKFTTVIHQDETEKGFDQIEGWFNACRLRSSSNYRSPIDWENLCYLFRCGFTA